MFRMASRPDFFTKVWPIPVPKAADQTPKQPLYRRLLHRVFYVERANGNRAELEIFAWARLT